MDTRSLEKILTKNVRKESLERLKAVLDVPQSFEALLEELPPEIRRLGPGAWLEAIGPLGGEGPKRP